MKKKFCKVLSLMFIFSLLAMPIKNAIADTNLNKINENENVLQKIVDKWETILGFLTNGQNYGTLQVIGYDAKGNQLYNLTYDNLKKGKYNYEIPQIDGYISSGCCYSYNPNESDNNLCCENYFKKANFEINSKNKYYKCVVNYNKGSYNNDTIPKN